MFPGVKLFNMTVTVIAIGPTANAPDIIGVRPLSE